MIHLSKLCCYSNRWLWVRLKFADVLKMGRYPLFIFFLFLGQKLIIVEQSCTLQGNFSLTFCHVLIAKYTNYLLSSSLTQHLFNSGYDKWLPSSKYMMSHVFSQLNTTWKGKLINQIELKLSNSFYICLNTSAIEYSYHWLSNMLNTNVDSY